MSPDETPPAPSGGAMSERATQVVTCFVLRRDRGQDEVLIVRRSDRVRTYRGRWAGVSGYVEPGVTPEAQAYIELREEARLAPADVKLLRAGAPLPVQDAEQGLSWVVYPFLFLTSVPERIHTDWEAHESRWVAPAEIPGLPTVPGLAAALAQVYALDDAGRGADSTDAPAP
jgi:8-oxo-dGTP diphosphatase